MVPYDHKIARKQFWVTLGVVIERERTVRSVLNGPSVLFLSQPLSLHYENQLYGPQKDQNFKFSENVF